MTTEAIIADLERTTSAEVAEIRSRAREASEARVASARAELEARVSAAIARAEPRAVADAGRRTTAARLQLLGARAERDAQRVATVHAEAERRLAGLTDAGGDGARWAAAVGRLAVATAEAAGVGATVAVRAADFETARRALHGSTAELVAVDALPPGVRATSADGHLEIDATVPTRLRRARVALAEAVAACLASSERR